MVPKSRSSSTHPASRAVTRHARPDAFGGLTGGGEPWSQFGGQHYELKSPLIDSGARIYDPDNAVFLSPDPVRATAGHGANPYQYGFQNPNSYNDPTGRWPEPHRDCLSAGCGVIGVDVRLSWDGTYEIPLGPDPTTRPPGVTSGIGHGVGGGEHVPGRTTGMPAIEPSLTIANFVDSRGGSTDAVVSAGAGIARDFIAGINSRGRASVLGVDLPPTDGAGLAADGVAQFFGDVATLHDSNASGFSRTLAGVQIGLSVWSSTATARSLAESVPSTAAALRALLGVGNGMSGGSAHATIVRTIAHGERVADIVAEGKALIFATGNEHALVSLTTGERVIVSGGPTGIDLSALPIRRLIGHTHPYHLAPTGPSSPDMNALQQLGQRSSFLLEHGDLIRFWLLGR